MWDIFNIPLLYYKTGIKGISQWSLNYFSKILQCYILPRFMLRRRKVGLLIYRSLSSPSLARRSDLDACMYIASKTPFCLSVWCSVFLCALFCVCVCARVFVRLSVDVYCNIAWLKKKKDPCFLFTSSLK